MDPIMDLLSELLVAIFNLLSNALVWGFNKLISKMGWTKKEPIRKITKKDLKNKQVTLDCDAIGYVVTQKRKMLGAELNKSAHTAIVGASGSGKTVLLDALMYEDMQKDRPIVYIDPKGDNTTLINFINLCIITQRDFAIFSDYYNGAGACAINPVKDGSSTNIADRIFHSFRWTEEHYAQICHDALEDAISLVQTRGEEVSIESIHNSLLEISDPKNKSEALYDRNNIEGILSRLRKIIQSDFSKRLKGKDALSFKEIRETKKCVYIGLSVLGFAEIARSLGKIILGDIAYSTYDIYRRITHNNLKELTGLGIYIDELSAIITDEFIEILNKCRGAKIELNFAFQSPSDISKISKELCTQVLENSANWFIFKQRCEEGANTFAEAIGTVETTKQTTRFEDGRSMDQGSERTVEELIAHHNIIKNLNVGQCILLQHYPTKIDLLNVKYIDPQILENNLKLFGIDIEHPEFEKAPPHVSKSLLNKGKQS